MPKKLQRSNIMVVGKYECYQQWTCWATKKKEKWRPFRCAQMTNEIMDNLYIQLNDRFGNVNSFSLLGKSFLKQHFWNYLKHKYWFWFCACEKWTNSAAIINDFNFNGKLFMK
jgi:hypothetical protein